MAELPSDEILYILNKINCTFTLGWKDSMIYLIFLLLFAISSNPCLKMWLVIFFFICGFKIYQVLTVFASSSFGRKKVVALIFFYIFLQFSPIYVWKCEVLLPISICGFKIYPVLTVFASFSLVQEGKNAFYSIHPFAKSCTHKHNRNIYEYIYKCIYIVCVSLSLKPSRITDIITIIKHRKWFFHGL